MTTPIQTSFTPELSEQKDIERAKGISKILNGKGLDAALGAASKMAKLITDTDKLVRRTEAVICEDVRLAEPFIDRCREIGDNYLMTRIVEAYRTGRIVGKYCHGLPKEYSGSVAEKASYLAGFAATYGYRNYVTLKTADKFGI